MQGNPRASARDSRGAPLRRAVTRRQLVAGAGVGAVGLAAVAGYGLTTDERSRADPRIPFYGPHQAGISTPPQHHLHFLALDLTAERVNDLAELLRGWSDVAAKLTTGLPLGSKRRELPPADPGEALGLTSSRLTVTFGLGPSLFGADGEDRLGIAHRRPPELAPLPRFQGEALEPGRSGGDVCIQACADDPQVAFHAVHALVRAGSGVVVPRWAQSGFRAAPEQEGERRRNLLGFKDGTNNLRLDDQTALRRHVWAAGPRTPSWMRGGSYLVARRIRILFDVWDGTSLEGQERAVGRHKATGAPLGGRLEHDQPDLAAGSSVPPGAHIRLAAPKTNKGQRLLRRSYSFVDAVESESGQYDAGLFFVCFQRDPARQFVPIQRRLAAHDSLSKHLLHTGSAIFACPPGARRSGYVGERLMEAL
jgi:deferrochelatase/peroxidase EfeB